MKAPSLSLSALLFGFAAAAAVAQLSPPQIPPPNIPTPGEGFENQAAVPMPNPKAERFISKVSGLQSEESRISVIATQRTVNEQLRVLAQQLRSAVQDRDQELMQLAQSRSVLLPTGKDASDMAHENEEWQSKDAKDFDKDYINRIIRIQKSTIDTLEDYARDDDSDPELAAFAQKHLPTLRENLLQAENLERQID